MTKATTNMFDIDMSKFTTGLKMPSVNFQAITASQQKNFEAIAAANKMAFEGVQEISRRQGEIVSSSVEGISDAVTSLLSATSFEDRAVKTAEFAKLAFQTTLANLWDLGDLVTKSNSRTFGVLNKRVADSLDEVKGIVGNQRAAA